MDEIAIVVAGQCNTHLAIIFEPVAQCARQCKNDRLFLVALARSTRIMAAVARVDHHQRQSLAPSDLGQCRWRIDLGQFDAQHVSPAQFGHGDTLRKHHQQRDQHKRREHQQENMSADRHCPYGYGFVVA